MEPKDLTREVLKDIRDEGRRTGERIDETNARLNETNARLNETNARLNETNARLEHLGEHLGRRIVESEMHTATAIADLAGTVRDLATTLEEDRDLR